MCYFIQLSKARLNRNFELNSQFGRVHWVHRSSFPPDRYLIRARKHLLGSQTGAGGPKRNSDFSGRFEVSDDVFGRYLSGGNNDLWTQ